MTTGKKNVLDWFEMSSQNSWTMYIYGKSDSSQIVCSSTPEIDAKRALQELGQHLDMHTGRFSIAACMDGKRSPRNDWRTDIEISGVSSVPVLYNQQPQTINGVAPEEVQKMVIAGINEYKTNEELKQLRAENAELKKQLKEKEKTDPWDKIGEIAMQFLPGMLGHAQAQVAGFPQATNFQRNTQFNEAVAGPEVDEHAQQVFEKFIAVLQRAAPNDWVQLIEKLANKIESNPGMVQQLKIFL